MPNLVQVALQMEFTGLLWAILGILGYIAHCIRPGWPPLGLCFLSFCVAFVYFVGSIRRSKNV